MPRSTMRLICSFKIRFLGAIVAMLLGAAVSQLLFDAELTVICAI